MSLPWYAERHVAQFDLAAQGRGHRHRVGGRFDRGGRAQQFADALQADPCLLVAVEHARQLLHRGEEQAQVQQEREQHARAERRRSATPNAPTTSTAACASSDSSATNGK